MDARYTDDGEGYGLSEPTREENRSLAGGGCRVSPVQMCFLGAARGGLEWTKRGRMFGQSKPARHVSGVF